MAQEKPKSDGNDLTIEALILCDEALARCQDHSRLLESKITVLEEYIEQQSNEIEDLQGSGTILDSPLFWLPLGVIIGGGAVILAD